MGYVQSKSGHGMFFKLLILYHISMEPQKVITCSS